MGKATMRAKIVLSQPSLGYLNRFLTASARFLNALVRASQRNASFFCMLSEATIGTEVRYPQSGMFNSDSELAPGTNCLNSGGRSPHMSFSLAETGI